MERLGRGAAWVRCRGYDQAEALKALRDAAEAYIEDLVEAGEVIPSKDANVFGSPAVAITV